MLSAAFRRRAPRGGLCLWSVMIDELDEEDVYLSSTWPFDRYGLAGADMLG